MSELDKISTLVTSPPTRLFSHLEYLLQLIIFGAIFPNWVGIPLAHDTDPSTTFPACHIKRVLGIDLVPRWNKFATLRIRTEYPCFPGGAELNDGLEKGLLVDASEDFLDGAARYWLCATPGWHFGLICRRLAHHHS